jgi:predicted phage baseplate assembly protein
MADRVPRDLRHRGRAVTAEDYEDLAMQASTEVARAKCLPLVDLAADPGGARRSGGVASLILVPRSPESNPMPTVALFDRVRRFLEPRRACSGRLVLAGPEYARLDLTVEVAVTNAARAGSIEQQVAQRLREFLHPVTGRGGAGAEFGRYPQLAELYAAAEEAPGVDHVRSLDIVTDTNPGRSAHFLVYPGKIAVTAVLE